MAAFESDIEAIHFDRSAVGINMHFKMGGDGVNFAGKFYEAAIHGFQPALKFAQGIDEFSEPGIVKRGFGQVIDFGFVILLA